MSEDTYAAVDAFIEGTLFAAEDEVLAAAQADADAAGLPPIQVTPPQARLLAILCEAIGASRILEFGTLGGYSTIVMARTLPDDGQLITLEYDPAHAEVARRNIERAGLDDHVEIKVGPALDALPGLENTLPFDFVFIDADKVNTPSYFAWAVDHVRPGGMIFADNVVRDGGIVDPEADVHSAAQRTLHEQIAAEPRVTATTIQTVGAKAYDGFTLALVKV